jgi:polygalacturonase
MKKFERRQFIKAGLSTTAGLVLSATMGSKALYANSGFAPQAQDLNITQFGAVGDGKALNTSAIQKAIDTCSRKGGGRVIVPKGTFVTGGILLKSNVDLHLEKDAVILGSPYMKDYPVRELVNDARYKKYLRYALVFAQGEKNISVSGEGTLNGNAQQGCKLGEFVDKSHASKRPCLLWFNECQNILVQDITYKNSAMWTETYSQCRNVHVNKITVTENYFFNADGCNMLDCDGFIIENCNINAMDDGICLKGYTNKGCSNGIIRNNKVRSICNGIKMGTDSSGGFRDIVIENNEVWQTGISGIALELTDGGIMENITVSNIKMNVVGTPIFIMLSNRNRPVTNDLTVPIGKLSNIRIKDIDAIVDKYETYNELERKYFNLTPYASSITGFPGYYVEDVAIDNVKIEIRGGFPERTSEDALREIPEAEHRYPENRMFGTLPAYGFFIRHARGIRMNNVSVSIAQKDGRPAFLLDDTHDSKFDDISVKSASGAAAFAVKPNCSGLQLDLA